MRQILLLLIFPFFSVVSTPSYAQEICDNGIDDDGDGQIDLNDPDCACWGILNIDRDSSLIPNHSFEDTLCTPTHGSQMECAENWIQASPSTSDYYYGDDNYYDFLRLGPGYSQPKPPHPGDGLGYVGFFDISRTTPNHTNGMYKEYIGTCLNRPMLSGQEYQINFFLAWGTGRDTLIVSIFGTPYCSALPWDGSACPVLSDSSWVELGRDTVILPIDIEVEYRILPNNDTIDVIYYSRWTKANISFTAPSDIYAVALGPSCDSTQSTLQNYYYADELILFKASAFSQVTIDESGKWCTGDLRLNASTDLSGGDWQWYRSGIALSGETSSFLNLMLYGTDEPYSVVYALNGDCIRTDYSVDTTDPANRSRELSLLNQDTAVCDSVVISAHATATRGYYYQWSPIAGVSDPNSLTPEINIEADTSIFYELTASYPGCPDTAMGFEIVVQSTPEIDLGKDTVVCPGDLVPLMALVRPYRSDYQYTWFPEDGLQFTNTPNDYFRADSSITYALNVSTPIGCTGADSIHIEVQPSDFAEVIPDTGYCPPEAIPLWASGGSTYQWEPAYGLNAVDIADPTASPETPTTYTVYVTSAYGCKDSQQVFIDVYPNAVISMPDTIRIYPGERYHLEPGTNCHYFNWFPTSGINSITAADPVFYPEVRTRYFVTARTEQGCTIKDSIDVLVEGTVIDIPNAFVPGKGVVPVFKPAKRGIAELIEFSVYNRWGNKVFSTTDIEKGWDGRYNGDPQPIGVYVYQIEAITDSGQRFRKEGDVTLIR